MPDTSTGTGTGTGTTPSTDVEVVFPAERDIALWERRHEAGEVPGRWPYGLDGLAARTDRLTAASVPQPSRASVLRSRLQQAVGRRAGGGAGTGTRQIGLAWDENAARRMLVSRPRDEMYSGVIWATDIAARGDDVRGVTRVLGQMTGLWVISRGQQDALRRLVGDRVPVAFFPFGVDELFYRPAPPAERPLVLSVGGDRDRDTRTLFAALAEVHDRSPLTEIIVQTSSTLEPPAGVTKLARVSHSELAGLYARASVVAIATRQNLHASGMTVSLEAMATARPVVITATPGIDDYVTEGSTGFLTPVGDAHRLASQVLELVDDEALGVGFGLAGRRAVEDGLTTRHLVDGLADFIGSAARGSAALNGVVGRATPR